MMKVNQEKHSGQMGNILAAAVRLFATRGYHETSMREIAGGCGLTKASIYHYFKSKDELLLVILDQQTKKYKFGRKEVWHARVGRPRRR